MLVSPSGGGKSTMAKRLLNDFENLKFSVSATTRPPREGEKNGIHYWFITKDDFIRKINSNQFLEWEEFYNGTLYGTLRESVENDLKKGYFVLLDIEVLGALNIQKMYGDEALTIFLAPPSMDILKERLEKRGTESDDTLSTRIERARREMTYADQFDTVVINDQLDDAYKQVHKLVNNFMKKG